MSDTESENETGVSRTMSRLQTLLSVLPRLTLPTPRVASLYEFTLFPNLPPELRNKIWRYAAYEPRVISILFNLKDIDPDDVNKGVWTSNVEDQTRHPGVM